ncbi:hypothetical protein EAI26_06505 [Lactobacillus sp. 0.1XD8-4]|nr:hypothetical protein [Lactobacillus sp. 0.1XD8-4]
MSVFIIIVVLIVIYAFYKENDKSTQAKITMGQNLILRSLIPKIHPYILKIIIIIFQAISKVLTGIIRRMDNYSAG